jgi:hypothetical protein
MAWGSGDVCRFRDFNFEIIRVRGRPKNHPSRTPFFCLDAH